MQVAFGPVREKLITKPELGHLKKAGVAAHRYVREFKLDDTATYEVGQVIKSDVFANGDKVDVTGKSKGKGFQGVIRRHGFGGGPGGHGSHFHRAPGSIGMCATPSRVFKGVRLPGHMGCDTVTVKNLTVMRVDEEQNLILVKGAIPGGKNGIVRVRMA